MKRNVCALVLCLLLLPVLILSVSASTYLPMVIDSAELLSGQERIELENQAQSLSEQYEMDIVILTVNSLDGKTAQNYADDYYDENGYGYGPEYSGVLFLLAMEEREWYISTCGEAFYALTDYGIEQIGETVVPFLSMGQYYDGFVTFLDTIPAYLDAYDHGRPVDGYADYSEDYYHGEREAVVHYQKRSINPFVPGLIIGLISALVAIGIMRASMNTKRKKYSAGDYLRSGSYRLRTHRDMFLYSNVSKVRRQQNNGGGHGGHGGGSSVHRSSGGRSHGGGGGKF